MALEPTAVQERISLETVEKDVKTYEDGVWHTLNTPMAPAAQRLAGYIATTYPEDTPLVLTEDYITLYHQGVMPPLRAMVEWERFSQPVPDGKGGMTIPVPSDYTPFGWALLAICPEYVFDFHAKDFRQLLKAKAEKTVAS